MMRAAIAALALLFLAGVAAAQDEPDPFADADDPFADEENPFAALEANVTDAEETLAAEVDDSTSGDVASEEQAVAPAPEATSADAAPAASEPPAGNDTPGVGVLASLAALLVAFALIKRR